MHRGRYEEEPDLEMSFAAALLTPFALLLPAAGAVTPVRDAPRLSTPAASDAQPAQLTPPPEAPKPHKFGEGEVTAFSLIVENFHAQAQQQVRVEQRITIRITPQSPPVQPNMLSDLPARAPSPPRFAERNMGNCISANGISGVQISRNNRLILYMRDQRMVSASLERACNARDYYSGFYVQRTPDGQICVNRDTLQSRSGASCKLSKIKQLVEVGN